MKDRAIISHNLWIAAGKPRNGNVADIRKKDKYAYRNKIRQGKVKVKSTISDSLHDALVCKDQGSFWKIWKSKFGSKKSLSKVVDGMTCKEDIANIFADSFSKACNYNSIRSSGELYSEFVAMKACYSAHIVSKRCSIELIDNIICKLKNGKAASLDNLTAEHIKYCHPIIISILNKLFNLMLKFEIVPEAFGNGLTIPIPKGDSNNSFCHSDDYRGITISPIISKVFEHCLLTMYGEYLSSSDLQLGFKKHTGVNQAIYSVTKTVEYFIERDTTISLCALDLSKAFDKVNRFALFIKLMQRKCPIGLINILDAWYSKSSTCVRWDNHLSHFVNLNAGVRQGSILSPFLFAVYANDILVKLQKSSLGCHIKHFCFNAFMYE